MPTTNCPQKYAHYVAAYQTLSTTAFGVAQKVDSEWPVSHYLKIRAQRGVLIAPACWLIGIPDREWLTCPEFTTFPAVWCFVGADADLNAEHVKDWHWYTDGSGGLPMPHPHWQRASWAVVGIAWCQSSHTWITAFAIAGTLLGYPQTVPRAEPWAVLELRPRASHSITVQSDSAYVVNGYAYRVIDNPTDDNSDMWLLARQTWPETTNVVKVQAHAMPLSVSTGAVSCRDFVGNTLPDAYAGAVFNAADVGDGFATTAELQVKQLDQIMERIACAHQVFLPHVPTVLVKQVQSVQSTFEVRAQE